MKKILVLILISTLGIIGCDDDSSSSNNNNNTQWGTEGNACYPNGTCNEGLICENDICEVGAGEGEEGGPCYPNGTCNLDLICENDICVTEDATPNPGEEGGPCLAGEECNEGLICENDICVTDDATPEPGEEGGPCLAGDECNGDLECIDDICVVDTTPDPGEEGGPCLTGDICNSGLVCYQSVCEIDADHDGYPVQIDCDDNNIEVFPGYVEVCNSQCNYGIRTCMSSGQWSQCTADTSCSCSTPGDTRQVDCGFCGTTTQHCNTDFEWELPTQCTGGGECFPGMEQNYPCGYCGNMSRTCTQSCEWPNTFSACQNPGECLPGYPAYTTEGCGTTGAMKEMNCNNICEMEPIADASCISEVPVQPRQNTTDASGNLDYKAEVCISAEQVYYTSDSQVPVTISPFCIDVYEVTNARYQECVDAGECRAVNWTSSEWNLPVSEVNWYDAMSFCRWDGGRTLPTRAEWLLAAKGPVPRSPTYAWGEDAPSSELVVLEDYYSGKMPVDQSIVGASYYGVVGMMGNVSEINYDWYSNSTDVSVLNPVVQISGNEKINSGFACVSPVDFFTSNTHTAYEYWGFLFTQQNNYLGFRCAKRFINNLNYGSK